MKSHQVSRQLQELWILSQDIFKAFNSIDLCMLRLCFDQLKFPSTLSSFIISLLISRRNRILTLFGKTESYDLLIVISPYIWSSSISANILDINKNEDVAVP
ncbi:4822_t:CDS:2, partial [Rhizophagus irregularis]